MPTFDIVVIRGDGIGVEVIEEGIKVLNAVARRHDIAFKFSEMPWGSDHYFKNGRMMPADAIATLRPFHAIYLGAVGHPKLQDHVTLNGLLLPIRRAFDQYVCERPSVLYPGVTSPLRDKKPYDIDMVVIRENTEGEYANVGGFQYLDFPQEIGVQTAVFTRHGCERVITYAFELARKRRKKLHVTSVTKSNAQGYGMVVWDRAFQAVAARYPDIKTRSLLVDAACMEFVRRPEMFDVVVGSNLFGDILTDLGAIITGSIGLAASGNIDPERRFPSMFEPTHGSAPDIAGKGIANPLAAILSGGMMLRHLGEGKAADAVEKASLAVVAEGKTLTPDLGGKARTSQVGDAVVAALG
ncbi:MAG: 3-isopropylmalate dehydrogenase [SAR202 cluster bacterium]|nr:3-isopropylmalate dehydrogenase [SAR202 cluster bacterium]